MSVCKKPLRRFSDHLLRLFDVLLRSIDFGMAKKARRRYDILGLCEEVGGLRDSKVVTLEVQLMLLGESLKLPDPDVRGILASSCRENHVIIRRADLLLVRQDCIDRFFVDIDGSATGLLRW